MLLFCNLLCTRPILLNNAPLEPLVILIGLGAILVCGLWAVALSFVLLCTLKLAEAFLSISLFTLPIIPSLSETRQINPSLKMKDHTIRACVIFTDHITDQVNHIPGLDKTARGRGGTAEPALTSGLASLPRCLLFTTVVEK